MASTQRGALLSLAIALGSAGCVAIDGGAAELSWSLRSFEGKSQSCAEAGVEGIRLCWESLDDSSSTGCRPGQFRTFPCTDEAGVTGFEIPVGRTKFFAEPVCAGGAPAGAGTFQAPPPIVRTVRDGEVVTLDSLLIVVTDQDNCSGDSCTCSLP
jgi:hypothetical protein